MTPLFLSRNPLILIEVLLIVSIVRAVWRPAMVHHGMAWFLRIAATFVIIGVVFNVLTVHSGDLVIGELPRSWPVVGGILTWNALVYGLLGGIALFSLVLTGITVSTLISWIDLFHVMPRRLAPVAVTGSVAWAFLPQTAVAWRQIREAQTMRGHRFYGLRDFIPIIVPLLAGGLDRSLMMAEALDARGFGASTGTVARKQSPWRTGAFGLLIVTGLSGLAVAVYCLSVGLGTWAIAAGVVGSISLAALVRTSPTTLPPKTRYRPLIWTSADSFVTLASLITVSVVIAWSGLRPDSLVYTPYPTIDVPPVDIPLVLILGLLMVPGFVFQPGIETP
ncbi:MAG: energy-coupling factor transporter transmembrane component T [Thermomicrobiales bacterium]